MKRLDVAIYHRKPWEVRCWEDKCGWEAEAWTKREALALKAQHNRGECARHVKCPECGHAAADHDYPARDWHGCHGAGWTDESYSELECGCELGLYEVMNGGLKVEAGA